jgi:hypothetical protein
VVEAADEAVDNVAITLQISLLKSHLSYPILLFKIIHRFLMYVYLSYIVFSIYILNHLLSIILLLKIWPIILIIFHHLMCVHFHTVLITHHFNLSFISLAHQSCSSCQSRYSTTRTTASGSPSAQRSYF